MVTYSTNRLRPSTMIGCSLKSAIFAKEAGPKTSPHYTFIPTHKVIQGLRDAGFVPVQARQSGTRKSSPGHARHIIRLRTPKAELTLLDAIPEVVLLNSHDGSSAYELRAGLFRPVCTNGLLVSLGDFVSVRIAHRGDVVERVVNGALEICERLSGLAGSYDVMPTRTWRSLSGKPSPVRHSSCGTGRPRRPVTGGISCSTVGGRPTSERRLAHLQHRPGESVGRRPAPRAPSGRLTRSRRIKAIREDVRLNTGLWDIATRYLAAA